MRMAQLVFFLFGALPKEERDSKRRLIYGWIRDRRLLATPVASRKGLYDVLVASLEMLRQTLEPGMSGKRN